jgi:hypothetical protein
MNSKPIIHAFIAAILALGEAVGDRTLQRAGDLIRDLLAHGVVGRECASILEELLVGIDHEPDPVACAIAPAGLYEQMTKH